MAKEKKKKKPQDLTDYSLRGIRNDVNNLWSVVEEINSRLVKVEVVPLPVFTKKKKSKKKKK